MANTLNVFRNGAVGFIEWLDGCLIGRLSLPCVDTSSHLYVAKFIVFVEVPISADHRCKKEKTFCKATHLVVVA